MVVSRLGSKFVPVSVVLHVLGQNWTNYIWTHEMDRILVRALSCGAVTVSKHLTRARLCVAMQLAMLTTHDPQQQAHCGHKI